MNVSFRLLQLLKYISTKLATMVFSDLFRSNSGKSAEITYKKKRKLFRKKCGILSFTLSIKIAADLKTQGSVVFPPRATRGAPADGPRMNFVISMGLPSFFWIVEIV